MPQADKKIEAFEPERYELSEPAPYRFELTRRELAGLAGAGLLILTAAPANAQRGSNAAPLDARLHIGEDGILTILSGKVEVGQGSRTELTMAAAEESGLPHDRIRIVMADTSRVPNDGITAGSRTTPSTVPEVRKAVAAARELLFSSAARQWNAGRESLRLQDGAVTNGTKTFGYADLAKSPELAALRGAMPEGTSLTAVQNWRTLGAPHHRLDGRDFVVGAHQFPSDVRRPGMLYGAVLRPPSLRASLESADLSTARQLPQVTAVHDGNFVACAAPTSMAARKAVAALAANARWKEEPHAPSTALFEHLKTTANREGGARPPRTQSRGDIQKGLADAAKRHRAEYRVAYIQHAPMEPRAAVAEWEDDRLTVWTGTQNPFGVRDQLAEAFRLTPDKVRVLVPDTGGGFGGKHTGEVAIEAARLARAAGKPVSLRWTRAEEFQWAYFRPAGFFEIEAGLDSSGLLTAWDFKCYNAGTAGLESPYRLANSRTAFLYTDSPLREGSYRGIAATANNFARECFMDELASLAAKDPLEFRLANLAEERLRNVVLAVTEKFRWRERRANRTEDRGFGLACGTEKGSHVAACAEVSVNRATGVPVVHEICMAFECGAILNPANLRSQVEGSIIQGLGGALTEQIEFENGRLKNGSFRQYRVPRFRDVPRLEIVLLNRRDLPSAGAGETPIIAVAPAIANAVFNVTSQRARTMPVRAEAGGSA